MGLGAKTLGLGAKTLGQELNGTFPKERKLWGSERKLWGSEQKLWGRLRTSKSPTTGGLLMSESPTTGGLLMGKSPTLGWFQRSNAREVYRDSLVLIVHLLHSSNDLIRSASFASYQAAVKESRATFSVDSASTSTTFPTSSTIAFASKYHYKEGTSG